MQFKFKLAQLFTFTLTLLIICSCGESSISVKSANFTPLSTNTYLHGTISFEATDTIGGLNYHWNFGDGTSEIRGHKTKHSYESSGLHTVTLEVDGLSSSRVIRVYPGNVSFQIKNMTTRELNILSNIDVAGNGCLNRIDLSRGQTSDTLYATTPLWGNVQHGINLSIFINNVEYSLNGFDNKFDWIQDSQHSIRTITDSTKCNYRIQTGSQIDKFFYIKEL